MISSKNIPQQPVVQGVIRRQFADRWRNGRARNCPESRLLQYPPAQPRRRPQPAPVLRAAEIAVVNQRVGLRVCRRQPQLARAVRQLQDAGHTQNVIPSPVRPAARRLAAATQRTWPRRRVIHIHLHIVARPRPLGGIAQHRLDPGTGETGTGKIGSGDIAGAQRRVHINQRMVAQVLPHAGQIPHYRDAQPGQMVARPHARQHQQLR